MIEVAGELISKPYVEITLRLLERFGVAVARDGWRRFHVSAPDGLRSPGRFVVEGDASSASYFIAAGAIAARDAPLRIEGVGSDSIQGDIAFVDAARAMGATIDAEANALDVRRGRFPLAPITLDCNHIPDAAMTLAALALFAAGTSRLTNIASWRVKETDRLAAMAAELRKVGASVVEGDDSLEITPPAAWRAASIATYDDHRMAMAMSLAAFNGARRSGALPVRILDPRCVAKTWPDYFEALFSVASAVPGERSRCSPSTARPPPARARWRARSPPLGYVLLDSGAVYRAVAIAALQAGVDADDEAPSRRSRRHGPALRRRPHLPRRRRRQRFASPRGRRRARLAHLGLAARAPRRPRRPDRLSPPARPGRRRARHGHRRLPRRRRSRSSSPRAPPNAPSAATSS